MPLLSAQTSGKCVLRHQTLRYFELFTLISLSQSTWWGQSYLCVDESEHVTKWRGGRHFFEVFCQSSSSQPGRQAHTHSPFFWEFILIIPKYTDSKPGMKSCLKISCRAWWASSYWTTSEPGPRKTLSWFRASSWLSDHLCRLWHVRSHPRTFPLSHPRAYFLLPCAQGTGCHWSVRPEWKLFGVGPSPNECWRVVYMWLGVELKHADTLQTLWNEVK